MASGPPVQPRAAAPPRPRRPAEHAGFSYCNLKQFDLAFKHCERAIDLDPRHRGAHEHIGGEAYLMTRDLAGAQKHLAALKAICLLPCEELSDLERAIARYQAKK